MYDFFEKLIKISLPRVRDFRGLSQKSFDGRGNYTLGIKEHIIFPEIDFDRIDKIKGPILCLVGPPGVGKTSLARSVAEALGRKFAHVSLGGVRDEAEIRGHRRTYIGAMPGKVIQSLRKVKYKNPLLLFDEIDKMTYGVMGDPAAALLEVLDPEQNHTFMDHYLEVEFDVSDVLFFCTANVAQNIPPALKDRMEVIMLSGYTELEKEHIAREHLLPKQMDENGLTVKKIQFQQKAILDIIRSYTREAGVRNLEREIAKICRKVAKELLLDDSRQAVSVSSRSLEKYLGVRQYRYGKAEEGNRVGQVTGLAWTEVGGELLSIEAAVMPGKGKQSYTGKLGDVMQESIQAAMTVVRTRSRLYGIKLDFYQKQDVHIHVPEGATPKDGPSAGIGMCTAVLSAITDIPVRSDVAMTGEITLRGEVLPVGGLKEKLLAAHRGGVKCVLIPHENEKDLAEIPNNVKGGLDIKPVRWIDEVFACALERLPEPLKDELEAPAAEPVAEEDPAERDQQPVAH
mgnify:CR=1 FL=1